MSKFSETMVSMFHGWKASRSDISLGVGLGLIPLAMGLCAVATPKAVKRYEKRREDHPEEHKAETVLKASVACYAPSAAVCATAITLIVYSVVDDERKTGDILTTLALTRGAYREYKTKVRETIGEKAETEIKDSIAKDHIDKNPKDDREVILVTGDDVLCYDDISGRYFTCSINKLDKVINDLNRQMLTDMYVSLNDFYYEVGLKGTRLGDAIGWNTDSGPIEIHHSYQGAENGEPCLVVIFENMPTEAF